jgi:hypothetical protein
MQHATTGKMTGENFSFFVVRRRLIAKRNQQYNALSKGVSKYLLPNM